MHRLVAHRLAMADISVGVLRFRFECAAPAAGSKATDAAIRRANMVRAKAMVAAGNIRPRLPQVK